MTNKTIEQVKDYYGKVLNSSDDLQTNACCSTETMPTQHKDILKNIAPEVLDKFYGCGAPIPPVLEGLTVLDLGCGSGRDVYLMSALVGEKGHVIGVDMTDEQLAVANKYKDQQAKAFGHAKSNVSFVKGYIEDLKTAGINDNSVDLIISNCVINLSPDKESVFKEIVRVLKPGGELFISDVFADRRFPQHLKNDSVLHGECISGALYIEDFRRLLQKLDIEEYRVYSKRDLEITNPEIKARVGAIKTWSITVRAFKLPLEDLCENYGQSVTYLGTIENHEASFKLDVDHVFKTGLAEAVCGNTFDMLKDTRLAKHFQLNGDTTTHYGVFQNCVTSTTKQQETSYC